MLMPGRAESITAFVKIITLGSWALFVALRDARFIDHDQ